MHTAPTVRIHAPRKIYSFLGDALPFNDIIVFELRICGIQKPAVLFYECECGRAGCPTFPMVHEIPEDIVEHLKQHVELNHVKD